MMTSIPVAASDYSYTQYILARFFFASFDCSSRFFQSVASKKLLRHSRMSDNDLRILFFFMLLIAKDFVFFNDLEKMYCYIRPDFLKKSKQHFYFHFKNLNCSF